jgi:hypothetical protein
MKSSSSSINHHWSSASSRRRDISTHLNRVTKSDLSLSHPRAVPGTGGIPTFKDLESLLLSNNYGKNQKQKKVKMAFIYHQVKMMYDHHSLSSEQDVVVLSTTKTKLENHFNKNPKTILSSLISSIRCEINRMHHHRINDKKIKFDFSICDNKVEFDFNNNNNDDAGAGDNIDLLLFDDKQTTKNDDDDHHFQNEFELTSPCQHDHDHQSKSSFRLHLGLSCINTNNARRKLHNSSSSSSSSSSVLIELGLSDGQITELKLNSSRYCYYQQQQEQSRDNQGFFKIKPVSVDDRYSMLTTRTRHQINSPPHYYDNHINVVCHHHHHHQRNLKIEKENRLTDNTRANNDNNKQHECNKDDNNKCHHSSSIRQSTALAKEKMLKVFAKRQGKSLSQIRKQLKTTGGKIDYTVNSFQQNSLQPPSQMSDDDDETDMSSKRNENIFSSEKEANHENFILFGLIIEDLRKCKEKFVLLLCR